MRKIIYLLLISLFIFSCGKKSNEISISNSKETMLPKVDKTKPDRDKTDLKKENIVGKVKTMEENIGSATSKGDSIYLETIYDCYNKEYNEKGNYISEFPCWGSGMREGLEYFYDSKGILLKVEISNANGSTGNISYKRDEKGNITEEFSKSINERQPFVTSNKYNENGLIVNKVCGNEKYAIQYTYKYDKEGNKIEEYSEGRENNLIKFKYDERGNEIETETEDLFVGSPKKIIKIKYSFDSKGNWIKKIEFDDNKPERIMERTFEYYVDN